MLTLNPLLTDNVVLQAEKDHLINGVTDPHLQVTLTISELSLSQISDSKGAFVFTVPPQPYGLIAGMRIETKNEIQELTVQYGDVFLFAGQSNMEYTMALEAHYSEELAQIKQDNIFFHVVPMPEFQLELEKESLGSWEQLGSENLGTLSAVAYYAIKEHRKNYPDRIIGIVVCSKGGTSASCWVSKADLSEDSVLNEQILAPFVEATKGKEKQYFDTEFATYLATYQAYTEKRTAWVEDHPELTLGQIKEQIGHSPWPPPANPYLFNRPGGLYQKMFKRIAPFTFSSVIWYQGEEDTVIGSLYDHLLKRLILRWRKDLMEQVPFYLVQLPIFKDKPQHDWPSVRQAQAQAAQTYQDSFLITTLDCGEVEDIHPTEKAVLGQRVGEILDNVYYDNAPVARVASWSDTKIVITVDQAASLKLLEESAIKSGGTIEKISIEGNQLIIEGTGHTISYAWENAPVVALFNEVGYPVAPFNFEK
ncbi:hypothetical protein JZO70_21010 [Enterococcus sp. 669A]|uniref:Sialate O-acetylesterase domain-containing protein n=1 Tax=Candidatus Enterococcus moelleringii TaxID=2815325 RepID=A0ABS3LGA3_9ENTE|nr:sialate O-acetylesterase [Enterococcus sp. 669A]MBO1308667.1 hypothetical protein [Enterococcus sp. 669A]